MNCYADDLATLTVHPIDAVQRPVLVIVGFATEAVVLHAALSALTPAEAYRRARRTRRFARSRQRKA
jgi:hypothetical protein